MFRQLDPWPGPYDHIFFTDARFNRAALMEQMVLEYRCSQLPITVSKGGAALLTRARRSRRAPKRGAIRSSITLTICPCILNVGDLSLQEYLPSLFQYDFLEKRPRNKIAP